jgi:hypothetical protein
VPSSLASTSEPAAGRDLKRRNAGSTAKEVDEDRKLRSKTMAIIKSVLEFGLLNIVVLVTGLAVLTAAVIVDWRMPQEQISKDPR